MKKIRIDLNTFQDKRDLHLYLKKQCNFPEYYGCNLDALYDCLSENNEFFFEIVENEAYEMYLLSIMKIFRKTKCGFEVVSKED